MKQKGNLIFKFISYDILMMNVVHFSFWFVINELRNKHNSLYAEYRIVVDFMDSPSRNSWDRFLAGSM